MSTNIIKTGADGSLSEEDARQLGQAAKSCKIIAFPTESSYAFGSTGLVKAATRRLLQIKERSTLKPLPILVHSLEEAKKWVEWTPLAESLAAKLWPGAVALLLRPTSSGRLLTFPEYPNLAIRVPSHPATRAMIAASGVPWVYTSANKSGRPPMARASEIAAVFGAELDLIVDAPQTAQGETTIVDATGDKPRVTKVGLVSTEQILEAAIVA